MYKTFRVKNFRCFKDLQINDLGRVNLIAGKNNTGKTALLEAMYLHTRPLSPNVLFDLQHVRGLEQPDGYMSKYWRQIFYQLDSALRIQLAGIEANTTDLSVLEITEFPNNKDTYNDIRHWYIELLVDRGRRDLLHSSPIADSVDVFLRFSLRENDNLSQSSDVLVASDSQYPVFANEVHNRNSQMVPTQGRPEEDSIRRQFSQIDSAGDLNFVIERLQVFEPRLEDLRLTEPYGIPMLAGRINGKLFPLRLMGDGINSACHFVLTMMADELDYLFIDEIENGIHYSVQKDVWKAIGQVAREQNIQVFATTHSYEMIEAAHEAFKDDDPYEFRFHRLNRSSQSGDIEAVTYNEAGVKAFTNTNYEVR